MQKIIYVGTRKDVKEYADYYELFVHERWNEKSLLIGDAAGEKSFIVNKKSVKDAESELAYLEWEKMDATETQEYLSQQGVLSPAIPPLIYNRVMSYINPGRRNNE